MPTSPESLRELADQLARGETTAEALCTRCIDVIAEKDKTGAPAFLSVFASSALEAARRVDSARHAGEAVPAFAGVPFAAKDLFDVEGKTTGAGAVVTDTDPPATQDAVVVSALRQAGLVLVGTTNMTEFAFSGLGLNPHFGTPESACWPGEGRAPGGSSSGAGVSLAHGMVPLSLGTDTAGSCRIPAAWNGVVGFKPTQSHLSREGVFPLSHTLDVPGPLALTVDCCRVATALMRGLEPAPRSTQTADRFRFIAPTFDNMPELESAVSLHYAAAIETLSQHGAQIDSAPVPFFSKAVDAFLSSPLAAFEAWHLHKDRLATDGARYDPNVARRLRGGEDTAEEAHRRNLAARNALAAQFREDTPANTFFVLPTTANTPGLIKTLEADNDAFRTANLTALTLTSMANYLDACAITIPIGQGIGLSLIGPGGSDDALLDAAEAVETALR